MFHGTETRHTRKKPQISFGQLQDEIRKRAQQVFAERSKKGIGGDELSDWLKAEKDIKVKHGLYTRVCAVRREHRRRAKITHSVSAPKAKRIVTEKFQICLASHLSRK